MFEIKKNFGVKLNPFSKPLQNTLSNNRGFSLIEIMVVVFILGLMAVLVLPSMRGMSRDAVKSGGTELSILINEAAIAAQANGKIYRITYDLAKGVYWAEYTSDALLLDSEEAKKIRNERKTFFKTEEKKEVTFIQDKAVNRKKRSLPIGVKFLRVYSEQSPDPIEEGEAHTHIFPHGLTERTVVQIGDNGENVISVVVLGLLGKTNVEGRAMTPKDVLDAPK